MYTNTSSNTSPCSLQTQHDHDWAPRASRQHPVSDNREESGLGGSSGWRLSHQQGPLPSGSSHAAALQVGCLSTQELRSHCFVCGLVGRLCIHCALCRDTLQTLLYFVKQQHSVKAGLVGLYMLVMLMGAWPERVIIMHNCVLRRCMSEFAEVLVVPMLDIGVHAGKT